MAVAIFFDVPHITADMAAQVSAYVMEHSGARQPEGGRFHAEGPTASGGWWSFDVWDSQEHFARFFEEYVLPALEQAGGERPQYRRLYVTWDTSQAPGRPRE